MKLSHTIISKYGNKENQTKITVKYDDGVQEVLSARLTTIRTKKDSTTGKESFAIESNDVDVQPMLEDNGLMDKLLDSVDWALLAHNERVEYLHPSFEHGDY